MVADEVLSRSQGTEVDPELPRTLHVVIVTGDRAVYDGRADRVIAPAPMGQITLLPRHAAMLAALEPGELVVRFRDDEQVMAIGGGFVEIRDDEVIVLADSAERAEEIDVARAEAARQRAIAAMKRYGERPEGVAASQALRRSRARLKVARRIGGGRRV
jgi:F-type H+-transporting ATPase subunit epsilon